MERLTRFASHIFAALLEGALIATLIVGIVAGTALASAGGGKPGGNGSTSSLTLVMVSDASGNGLPDWGDKVTFRVSTTATTEPHVSLTCSQNGVVVYGAAAGFYAGYPWPETQTMTLSSASWVGGSADCTAKLYYFNGRKTVTLKTLRVAVGA